MTGKQRAYLRSLANPLPALYQAGKGGCESESFLEGIRQGLEKNELVKITVLETCEYSPGEVSQILCRAIGCEPVQVIGKKVVLYKESETNKTIVLPD